MYAFVGERTGSFIPTSLHPYIPTSLHPYIPTSLHPYIPTSLHPYIPTSLHPYIPTSAGPRAAEPLERLCEFLPAGIEIHPFGQLTPGFVDPAQSNQGHCVTEPRRRRPGIG